MTTTHELGRNFSLSERLRASSERLPVPGEPSRTVSAPLAHLPTSSHTMYSRHENGPPILSVLFEFASDLDEDRVPCWARSEDGDRSVKMEFGQLSGRIYRMELEGMDLLSGDAAAHKDGMEACLNHYVEQMKATMLQQLIMKSVTGMVAKLIPSWMEHFRHSVAEGGNPPSPKA